MPDTVNKRAGTRYQQSNKQKQKNDRCEYDLDDSAPDLYGLYELAHVAGWTPYDLLDMPGP